MEVFSNELLIVQILDENQIYTFNFQVYKTLQLAYGGNYKKLRRKERQYVCGGNRNILF